MHRRKIDRDPAVYTSKAKASATAYRLPIALTDSGCSGEEAGAGGESSFQSPTGSSRASNAREDAKAKDPAQDALDEEVALLCCAAFPTPGARPILMSAKGQTRTIRACPLHVSFTSKPGRFGTGRTVREGPIPEVGSLVRREGAWPSADAVMRGRLQDRAISDHLPLGLSSREASHCSAS